MLVETIPPVCRWCAVRHKPSEIHCRCPWCGICPQCEEDHKPTCSKPRDA